MAKITNKKMYRDLMRMDGARMRDLNPMSRAHYAAAAAEPIVKTGAKVVGVVVGAAAIGMGVTACPTNTSDPITCDCPDEATHLEVGANNVVCPADVCPHEGKDCTAKVNETLNAGGITVIKEPGVSTADFNAIVAELNIVVSLDGLSVEQIANFKTKFPTIYIVKGKGINHKFGALTIGCNETADSIYDYLVTDNSLVQAQTKNTWLADKGNKGREWVAKNMKDYATSVADLRNIAYDKANGISI